MSLQLGVLLTRFDIATTTLISFHSVPTQGHPEILKRVYPQNEKSVFLEQENQTFLLSLIMNMIGRIQSI